MAVISITGQFVQCTRQTDATLSQEWETMAVRALPFCFSPFSLLPCSPSLLHPPLFFFLQDTSSTHIHTHRLSRQFIHWERRKTNYEVDPGSHLCTLRCTIRYKQLVYSFPCMMSPPPPPPPPASLSLFLFSSRIVLWCLFLSSLHLIALQRASSARLRRDEGERSKFAAGEFTSREVPVQSCPEKDWSSCALSLFLGANALTGY